MASVLILGRNECLNPVTGLPAPLRILCCLTSGNRHLYYPGSLVNLCAHDDCQDAARGRVPASVRRPVTRFDGVGMSQVKVVSSVPPLWCVVMAWIGR